jgi:mannan endo-1,4-beta-mannosidase
VGALVTEGFAIEVRSLGRTVFLRWFAEYILAYQRIRTIFQQVGATNVSFVWAPSAALSATSAIRFYPGSEYVNWVGTDLYDRPPTTSCEGPPSTCRDFQSEYETAYGLYSVLGKPMMITETGWAENRGRGPC